MAWLPIIIIFYSNLLELLCFDEGISACDLLSADLLEIERTPVILRVPVGPAKRNTALASESGQPDPLPANHAPIRLLLR